MITLTGIVKTETNIRTRNDERRKCDRYTASFSCPADQANPDGDHTWLWGFEVARGETVNINKSYPNKSAARSSASI